MIIEEWRWIKNYENKYMISNTGKVYSQTSEMYKSLSSDKDGYYFVILHGNGKPLKKFVHALVLETFVSPRPKGMISRHYPDQTKTNNNIDNLSWCEPAVNSRDRQELGHSNTVLTEDIIIEIKNKLLSGNYTQADLYKEYNVSSQTICDIANEKGWRGVGPDISIYNFDKRRILTDLEISQIRGCINAGYESKTIQKYFNLKESHYYKLLNNLIKPGVIACEIFDIPKDIVMEESSIEKRRKIKTEEYDKIKDLLLKGQSLSNIAKKYSVNTKTIYTIKKKLGL
jgi:hypothetical protein